MIGGVKKIGDLQKEFDQLHGPIFSCLYYACF